MSFLRIKTIKKKSYLYRQTSVRKGKKVHSMTEYVCYLGWIVASAASPGKPGGFSGIRPTDKRQIREQEASERELFDKNRARFNVKQRQDYMRQRAAREAAKAFKEARMSKGNGRNARRRGRKRRRNGRPIQTPFESSTSAGRQKKSRQVHPPTAPIVPGCRIPPAPCVPPLPCLRPCARTMGRQTDSTVISDATIDRLLSRVLLAVLRRILLVPLYRLVFGDGFRVPYRGSVNPTPLGGMGSSRKRATSRLL